MFLLNGNVRDVFPWSTDQGTEYLTLRQFLERFLARSKEIVAYYNVSEGLCFPSAGMGARCKRVINSQRLLQGEPGLDE